MNVTGYITRTGGFMSSTEAIKSTFSNRETSFRANHPLFTEDFFIAKDRQTFWNGIFPYWESMK